MVYPVLLSGHTMTRAGLIRPISMSLNLKMDGLSTATMVLDVNSEPALALGNWVLITAPMGNNSGVFYVKTLRTDYVTGQYTVTLEHTFGLLQEMVAFGEITPETIGGAGATTISINSAINYLLNCQTERLWQLNQNDFSSVSEGWKFTHMDIYNALMSITDSVADCQWEFDQTVLPWKLSLKRFPTATTMEMRKNRNIESMRVSLDRSNMYTRVYPTGKNNLHIDSVNGGSSYLDKNTSTWGVIAKVITDSSIDNAALLKSWAAAELNRHSTPAVSVSIGGLELSAATGESLDALKIGRLCRVPLPDYNTTVTERIVELAWRDCILNEEAVTVTLANELRTIQGVLYEIARGGGGGGGKSNLAKDCELEETEEKLEEFDNADIWINRDSVWAVCAAYDVVTDAQGNKHIRLKDGSLLEVKRDGIYETVGTSQAISEVDNTVTNTIMGSTLWTTRNDIAAVTGEFDVVTDQTTGQKRLVVKSGGGLKVERDGVEFGIYDSGSLDAGVIVDKVNHGTVKILGSKVQIGNSDAETIINGKVTMDQVVAKIGEYDFLEASGLGAAFADLQEAHIPTLSVEQSLTVQTQAATWHDFNIDGQLVAEFIGTADVNFDRAAARREGANSVYISPSDIKMTEAGYELNGGNPYYDVLIEATAISSMFPSWSTETSEQSIRVYANDAYEDGKTAGAAEEAAKYTQTTVTLQGVKTVIYKRGTERKVTLQGTKTVIYKRGTKKDVTLQGTKTVVYRRGEKRTGNKIGTEHTDALYGGAYLFNKAKTELFYKNGTTYASLGSHVWHRDGTAATLYEKGSAYTLYTDGGSAEYYDAGTDATLYEDGGSVEYYAAGTEETLYEDGGSVEYYAAGKQATYYTKQEEQTGE